MGNNPPDCPLYEIRLLPLKERYKWVEELSEEDCLKFFFAHQNCFFQKTDFSNESNAAYKF
jgi:hypothetical protein